MVLVEEKYVDSAGWTRWRYVEVAAPPQVPARVYAQQPPVPAPNDIIVVIGPERHLADMLTFELHGEIYAVESHLQYRWQEVFTDFSYEVVYLPYASLASTPRPAGCKVYRPFARRATLEGKLYASKEIVSISYSRVSTPSTRVLERRARQAHRRQARHLQNLQKAQLDFLARMELSKKALQTLVDLDIRRKALQAKFPPHWRNKDWSLPALSRKSIRTFTQKLTPFPKLKFSKLDLSHLLYTDKTHLIRRSVLSPRPVTDHIRSLREPQILPVPARLYSGPPRIHADTQNDFYMVPIYDVTPVKANALIGDGPQGPFSSLIDSALNFSESASKIWELMPATVRTLVITQFITTFITLISSIVSVSCADSKLAKVAAGATLAATLLNLVNIIWSIFSLTHNIPSPWEVVQKIATLVKDSVLELLNKFSSAIGANLHHLNEVPLEHTPEFWDKYLKPEIKERITLSSSSSSSDDEEDYSEQTINTSMDWDAFRANHPFEFEFNPKTDRIVPVKANVQYEVQQPSVDELIDEAEAPSKIMPFIKIGTVAVAMVGSMLCAVCAMNSPNKQEWDFVGSVTKHITNSVAVSKAFFGNDICIMDLITNAFGEVKCSDSMKMKNLVKEMSKLLAMPLRELRSTDGATERLLALPDEVARVMETTKTNRTNAAAVRGLSGLLVSMHSTLLSRISEVKMLMGAKIRPDPIPVLFSGPRGVGKSHLLPHLFNQIKNIMKYNHNKMYQLNRSPDAKYYNTYTGEEIAMVDEFLFDIKNDSVLLGFNNIFTSVPYTMQGASLSEKKQNFESRLVLMTSNVQDKAIALGNKADASAAAIWSRIIWIDVQDPVVQACSDPRFTEFTHRKPDFSHLTLTHKPHLNTNQFGTPEVWDIDELIEYLVQNLCTREIAFIERLLEEFGINMPEIDRLDFLERRDELYRIARKPVPVQANAGRDFSIFRFQGSPGSGKTHWIENLAARLSNLYSYPVSRVSSYIELPQKEEVTKPRIYILDDIIFDESDPKYVEWINATHAKSVFFIGTNIQHDLIRPKTSTLINSFLTTRFVGNMALSDTPLGPMLTQKSNYYQLGPIYPGSIRRLGLPGVHYIPTEKNAWEVVDGRFSSCITLNPAQILLDGKTSSRSIVDELIFQKTREFISRQSEDVVIHGEPPVAPYTIKIGAANKLELLNCIKNRAEIIKAFAGTHNTVRFNIVGDVSELTGAVDPESFLMKMDAAEDDADYILTSLLARLIRLRTSVNISITAGDYRAYLVNGLIYIPETTDVEVNVRHNIHSNKYEVWYGRTAITITEQELVDILARNYSGTIPLIMVEAVRNHCFDAFGQLKPQWANLMAGRYYDITRQESVAETTSELSSSPLWPIVLSLVAIGTLMIAGYALYRTYFANVETEIESNGARHPKSNRTKRTLSDDEYQYYADNLARVDGSIPYQRQSQQLSGWAAPNSNEEFNDRFVRKREDRQKPVYRQAAHTQQLASGMFHNQWEAAEGTHTAADSDNNWRHITPVHAMSKPATKNGAHKSDDQGTYMKTKVALGELDENHSGFPNSPMKFHHMHKCQCGSTFSHSHTRVGIGHPLLCRTCKKKHQILAEVESNAIRTLKAIAPDNDLFMDFAKKLEKNLVQVHTSLGRAHGFAIKGKTIISVAHLIREDAEKELVEVRFDYKGNPFTCFATVKSINRKRDMVFLELVDKKIENFPDISKKFAPLSELEHATIGGFVQWYKGDVKVTQGSIKTYKIVPQTYADPLESNWKFCENDLELVPFGYTFNSQFIREGDCGLPCLFLCGNEIKIGGFHNGYLRRECRLLFSWYTQEDMNVASANSYPGLEQITSFGEPMLITPEIKSMLDDCKVDGFLADNIESWGGKPSLRDSSRNKPHKIMLGDEGLINKRDSDFAPQVPEAVIDKSELYWNPIKQRHSIGFTQLKKFGEETVTSERPIDEKCWKRTVDYMLWYMKEKYGECKILTTGQVINGVRNPKDPVFPYAGGLDMKTSPGAVFTKVFGDKTKGDAFKNIAKEDQQPFYVPDLDKPSGAYLQRTLDMYWDAMGKGHICASAAKACLKQEILPIEKVRKGGTRLFQAVDTDRIILRARLTRHLMWKQFLNRSKCVARGGANIYVEATEMRNYLDEIDGTEVFGDYSRFDKSILIRIAMEYTGTRFLLLPKKDQTEENYNRFFCETLGMIRSIQLMEGSIFIANRGNLSGQADTLPMNDYANHFAFVYAMFRRLSDQGNDIDDISNDQLINWYRLVTVGDDNWAKFNHLFNMSFDDLCEYFKEIGFKLTPSNKGLAEEETFCSRLMNRDKKTGLVFPALKKSSINRQLHFTSDTTPEQLTDLFRGVILEAGLWDKEYYDSIIHDVKVQCTKLDDMFGKLGSIVLMNLDLRPYHVLRRLWEQYIRGVAEFPDVSPLVTTMTFNVACDQNFS